MSRSQDLKRKIPESISSTPTLSDADSVVLNVIKERKDMAIWVKNIKRESKLQDNVVNKSLKSLLALKMIKEVPHIQFKGKHYIATEFKPSNEVTGGSWYKDGNLNKVFIGDLKEISLKVICKLRVATAQGVTDFFNKNMLPHDECTIPHDEFTIQKISEILKSMALDNKIMESKSNGLGEYHGIPIGAVCYRCSPAGALGQGLETVIPPNPCIVCPRISQCTSDGIISPSTCVYYTKWLNF